MIFDFYQQRNTNTKKMPVIENIEKRTRVSVPI